MLEFQELTEKKMKFILDVLASDSGWTDIPYNGIFEFQAIYCKFKINGFGSQVNYLKLTLVVDNEL